MQTRAALHRASLCAIGLLASMTAQNRPFRVQTKVVLVPVSVTDKNGRYVDGLTARDFNVRDDGALQEIAVDDFSTGLAPISLVIAIQTSGISMPALAKVRKIGGMIEPLVTAPRGDVAVVTFDEEIQWLQDFTREDEKIRRAVKNLKTWIRPSGRAHAGCDRRSGGPHAPAQGAQDAVAHFRNPRSG
jgi:VWFA-related protein